MADALDSGNATSVKVIISALAVIINRGLSKLLHLGCPRRVKFRGQKI